MAIVQRGGIDGKACRTCQEWKPLTEFYSLGKRSADCKICEKARKSEKWHADADASRQQRRAYRAANAERFLGYMRQRYAQRANELNTQRRKRYAEDKDLAAKIRKEVRGYREKHPDKVKELNQAYRATHADKLREDNRKRYARTRDQRRSQARANYAANPTKTKEQAKQWRIANPEKRKAQEHRRRALRLTSTRHYTAEEWQELCAWFGNVCLACGKAEITVDHVIPLSKYGSNSIENLQPLCFSCNSHKRTRIIDYRDPEQLATFLELLRCAQNVIL